MKRLTILGCGGSAGVPTIGNNWGACDPSEPKNRRMRCSVLVESDTTRVVIDTGPDFREQFNIHEIRHIDGVLYTHFHGDHTLGFEELRMLYDRKNRIPLWADPVTETHIKRRFANMFDASDTTGFYPVSVEFQPWSNDIVIGDLAFKTVPMQHSDITAYGYRMGNLAYCTDVSEMTDAGYAALENLETLIIDCNNMFTNETRIHVNLEKVFEINARVNAANVILTHLKNNCDYKDASARLPHGYSLAYDGMVIEF